MSCRYFIDTHTNQLGTANDNWVTDIRGSESYPSPDRDIPRCRTLGCTDYFRDATFHHDERSTNIYSLSCRALRGEVQNSGRYRRVWGLARRQHDGRGNDIARRTRLFPNPAPLRYLRWHVAANRGRPRCHVRSQGGLVAQEGSQIISHLVLLALGRGARQSGAHELSSRSH